VEDILGVGDVVVEEADCGLKAEREIVQLSSLGKN
jgi:hypothetical protein